MSAKHAVLGMLLDGPGHQYGLAARLRQRLGPGGEINSGHLSKTIRVLEQDGLIRFVGFDVRDRRRKIFEITQGGVAEIERWWSDRAVPDAQSFRQTLLLKVALAGPDGLEEALSLCAEYEHACLERINEISRLRKRVETIDGPMTLADDVVLDFSLSADISVLKADLEVTRHAQKVIRWLLTDAVWPGTRKAAGSSTSKDEGPAQVRAEMFGRMAARHLGSTVDRRGGE
jgi:DNA-binding PadR family transcriptional regulator